MAKYIDENGFAHFLGKLKTLLDGKVNTESGKGLSTNDYTTAEKNKLAGIAANANNYSLPTASDQVKGGVKIGAGLTMTGEVLSADVQSVPVMTGATSSADGTAGLVPAPESGPMVFDQYLRADGSWFTPPNNNDRVSILYAPTTKASLLATTYIPVDVSDTTVEPAVTDPDVYLDTTAGKLTATSFSGSGAELTNLNGSNISSGTVAAARLPDASSSAKGAMSAAHYSKLEALPTNATLQSTYALKSDITSMYKHKGSVSSTSNLPSSGQTAGDVYNVTSTGMNYVWTGSEWDALGEIFTINSMTTTEIDAAFVTAGLTAA